MGAGIVLGGVREPWPEAAAMAPRNIVAASRNVFIVIPNRRTAERFPDGLRKKITPDPCGPGVGWRGQVLGDARLISGEESVHGRDASTLKKILGAPPVGIAAESVVVGSP